MIILQYLLVFHQNNIMTRIMYTSSPPHCDGSSKSNGSFPQMIPCYQNSLGIRLARIMTGSLTMGTYCNVAM